MTANSSDSAQQRFNTPDPQELQSEESREMARKTLAETSQADSTEPQDNGFDPGTLQPEETAHLTDRPSIVLDRTTG